MKCSKCGAEWTSNISGKVAKCPFCGEPLAAVSPYGQVTDALSEIIQRFGANIYCEESRLYGLLSDILPKAVREKNVLKTVIYLGVPGELVKILSAEEKRADILRQCYVSIESAGLSADWCADVLYMLGLPLGIQTQDLYPLNRKKDQQVKQPALEDYAPDTEEDYGAKTIAELDTLSEEGVSGASVELGLRYFFGSGVPKDKKKAVVYYKRAEAAGNAVAQYYLGKLYDEGDGVDHDPALAFTYYQKAAVQDYPPAEFSLAEMYYLGQGCERNDKEAIYWLKKIDDKLEDSAVCITLAMIYRESNDETVRDYAKAFEYGKKAANLGNEIAYNFLGTLYEAGCGVEQDYKKALYYYQLAADKGVEVAYLSLGAYYQSGYGTEKDERKAAQYFQLGANVGNMYCLNALGMCYKKGIGVPQDYKRAFELFLDAAYAGNFAAEMNVGLAYDEGRGVEQDKGEAKKWFLSSASKGYSKAMMALGFYAEKGIPDQKPSIDEAFNWYLKAANVGDHGIAQWIIGNCRTQGLMNSYIDKCEGFSWYLKAAKNGHPTAQNNVACEYMTGIIVDQDYSEAIRWFEAAVAQNDPYALCNYGIMLLNGNGVKRDVDRAFSMIKLSAEQGYVDAQLNLGICYYEGWGTSRNLDEALRLLTLAYEADRQEATTFLEKGFRFKNGRWVKKGLFERVPPADELPHPMEVVQPTQGCNDFCEYASELDDEEHCMCKKLQMKVFQKEKCPFYKDTLGGLADVFKK